MRSNLTFLMILFSFTLHAKTAEEIKRLDELPESTMKSSEVVLPNGEKNDHFLLKNDPCFLVKFPSDDENINKKAKERCKK